MKKIHLIAAARPNFMKIAPLYHALKKTEWALPQIVHTGQHYDHNMSGSFFEQLALPEPHHHLGVGSGSHAEQVGSVLIAYEQLLLAEKPDLCVVVGDVNSTIACALAAVKLLIPVAHVEAGLRSRDMSMPEEINRLLTDRIANILLTPSKDGDDNLLAEGIPVDSIHCIGNVMIDSLEFMREQFERSTVLERYSLQPQHYALATFHRPANVDNSKNLHDIIEILAKVSHKLPVVFPVHPRTQKNLDLYCRSRDVPEHILFTQPEDYVHFMRLTQCARFVLTDSGGIQEETSYFGVPCLTYRDNTERPVTISHGTNVLVNKFNVLDSVERVLTSPMPTAARIPLWDGHAAERAISVFQQYFASSDERSKSKYRCG